MEAGRGGTTAHAFQVDLRGLVDLLSHHLYSSPRVYLRELLQNAVDAITARRATADGGEPAGSDAPVRIEVADGVLRIHDDGVGLTEADVHTFVATIGRSAKRDQVAGLETARREFLGQFGIGLLACFMVADRIQVVSRSAVDASAAPVEWVGESDGSYTVRTLAPHERPEPGTTVTLTARVGCESWFEPDRVVELARDVGSLLRYPITVAHGGAVRQVTDTPPVWERPYGSPVARRQALLEYGERVLGFRPLDAVDLAVPLAGVRGVGYVLPHAISPAGAGRHRVHLKGMLLSDAATGLLPEWAFFVRCVIDCDTLRPTASREALYDDDTLHAVRDALGIRLRDWLGELAAGEPDRVESLLAVHELGVKALARDDDEVLRLMLPWLRVETATGVLTLDEVTRRHPHLHVTSSVDEFRQVAAIAAAQGLGVVNGGYVYDADVVARLPRVVPGVRVERLDPGTLLANLSPVDPAEELALAGLLAIARSRLDHLACDVVVRGFLPASVPALYLAGRDVRAERTLAEAQAAADGLWSQILGSMRGEAPRAQIVLNEHHPLLRRLAALPDPDLTGTAVESLYGQALLMSRRPLQAADIALLNRTFGDLLGWAIRGAAGVRPASGPGSARGEEP